MSWGVCVVATATIGQIMIALSSEFCAKQCDKLCVKMKSKHNKKIHYFIVLEKIFSWLSIETNLLQISQKLDEISNISFRLFCFAVCVGLCSI